VAGVSSKQEYVAMLEAAGFQRIDVTGETSAAALVGGADLTSAACACADPTVSTIVGELMKSVPMEDLVAAARLVVSAKFAAHKPGA
jgi:hypothetical protein